MTEEPGSLCILHSREFGSCELRPGGSVRIGRHRKNDLVIDDPAVSRFHARVLWEPARELPELLDAGSANGTVVDGVRVGVCNGAELGWCPRGDCKVRHAKLRHESKIVVHDHEIEVELERHALLEDTPDEVVLFTDQRTDFQGQVTRDLTMQWLMARLENQRRTGTLVLELPRGAEATVVYCLGRIMWAEHPDGTGLRALERILGIKRAPYRFTRNLVPQESPMDLWLSDYLLDRKGFQGGRDAARKR
jgi:pSer/pThr/pTyr-binding forkhead associated (FHA) protein